MTDLFAGDANSPIKIDASSLVCNELVMLRGSVRPSASSIKVGGSEETGFTKTWVSNDPPVDPLMAATLKQMPRHSGGEWESPGQLLQSAVVNCVDSEAATRRWWNLGKYPMDFCQTTSTSRRVDEFERVSAVHVGVGAFPLA